MILENGTIRTFDPVLPLASALAIAGDRIVGGIGTHETALAPPTQVDLRGMCVIPGFSDAHVHFPSWAVELSGLRLEGARSLDEAVAAVAEAARAAEAGQWLRGTGWRAGDWTAGEPTRQALDAISADTPVMLESKDGHSLWLNSAALAQANGDLETDGGVVERDAAGEPTGILRERSAWRFCERFRPSADEFLSAMRPAIKVAHARGVTAIHDKDGAFALPLWQRLHRDRALTLRVWQSLPHERLDELAALGLRSGFGDDLLRLGYLKVFMDGALGSGTALMLDGSGVEITSREELEQIIRRAARAGWPVAVHAIGDGANRAALDAFEATVEEWQPLGLRQRIEHAQLVHPDDIRRFGHLKVAASVQFSHAPSDRALAEAAWADKLEGAYAYAAIEKGGAVIANGSDAPVEALDPLAGIRAAVLRTLDDRPSWRPEHAIELEQALIFSTVTPAWLAYDEHRRGRLKPGFLADLVVLDRDPLATPLDDLHRIEVVATMVGGRWVHNPPPWR